MRSRSRLSFEPLGQALLNLVLGNDAARLNVLTAALYALKDIEVVLDVLERGLLRKAVENLSRILLCGCRRLLRVSASHRTQLPVGALFCVIDAPTCGRPWSGSAARAQLRRLAVDAGVRRRFAPHQLRHDHRGSQPAATDDAGLVM